MGSPGDAHSLRYDDDDDEVSANHQRARACRDRRGCRSMYCRVWLQSTSGSKLRRQRQRVAVKTAVKKLTVRSEMTKQASRLTHNLANLHTHTDTELCLLWLLASVSLAVASGKAKLSLSFSLLVFARSLFSRSLLFA